MKVIRDGLRLCVDCLMYAVNGDTSGIDESTTGNGDSREAQVIAGVNALGEHLVPAFDSETGKGIEEFAAGPCDACHAPHAGEFHEFAILGKGEEEPDDADDGEDDDGEDDDKIDGYHDCDCCGETIMDQRVCDGCLKAGCSVDGDSCELPTCDVCGTVASLMNDQKWHSNCDAPCANAGKSWPAT